MYGLGFRGFRSSQKDVGQLVLCLAGCIGILRGIMVFFLGLVRFFKRSSTVLQVMLSRFKGVGTAKGCAN